MSETERILNKSQTPRVIWWPPDKQPGEPGCHTIRIGIDITVQPRDVAEYLVERWPEQFSIFSASDEARLAQVHARQHQAVRFIAPEGALGVGDSHSASLPQIQVVPLPEVEPPAPEVVAPEVAMPKAVAKLQGPEMARREMEESPRRGPGRPPKLEPGRLERNRA